MDAILLTAFPKAFSGMKINSVTPVLGDFMFSVCFHVRRRCHRRDDFSFSCKNVLEIREIRDDFVVYIFNTTITYRENN